MMTASASPSLLPGARKSPGAVPLYAPRRITVILMTAGLAIAFPLLARLTGNEFYIGFASRVMVYMMAVSSLNLLVGYAGVVSFGHAAYFGLGAYAMAILALWGGNVLPAWTQNLWFSWPFAMLCAALFALLVGFIAFRTKPVHSVMITLAFGQVVYFLATGINTFGGDNGMPLPGRSPTGIKGFDLGNDTQFFYTVLVLLTAVMLALHSLIHSRFGVIVRAIAVNESRMAAIGFPVFRYKLACFVIGGAIAGLAGALLANQNSFVTPHMLDWVNSGNLLVMLILGGVSYLAGGLYGTLAMLVLQEILSEYTHFWHAYIGLGVIAVVLLGNGGIAGLIHGKNLSEKNK